LQYLFETRGEGLHQSATLNLWKKRPNPKRYGPYPDRLLNAGAAEGSTLSLDMTRTGRSRCLNRRRVRRESLRFVDAWKAKMLWKVGVNELAG
jgi:hypothetical protein